MSDPISFPTALYVIPKLKGRALADWDRMSTWASAPTIDLLRETLNCVIEGRRLGHGEEGLWPPSPDEMADLFRLRMEDGSFLALHVREVGLRAGRPVYAEIGVDLASVELPEAH